MSRVYNFSAGPAVLPEEVLREAAAEMLDYQGSGMSVMEMSHRSKDFQAIIDDAEKDLRELMQIPDNYKVLFVQGGGNMQFAMVPMNLFKNKVQFVGKLNLFHDTLQLFKRSADFCSFSRHCLQKYGCCLFFFQIFVKHFRNQADSFLGSLTDMASRMKIIIISRNVFHTPQVICKGFSGKGTYFFSGCTGI